MFLCGFTYHLFCQTSKQIAALKLDFKYSFLVLYLQAPFFKYFLKNLFLNTFKYFLNTFFKYLFLNTHNTYWAYHSAISYCYKGEKK